MDLTQQVAIVTGGARGIGREICLALAREGATVAACDRDHQRLETLPEQARQEGLDGAILPRVLDVTDRAAVETLVEQTVEQLGRIDILVNNAGITRDGLLMSMEDDQFDSV
ncbi:MAG: SDR family NAD(P)-dependent oxidoreductase, partial [Phycisphaerae bacterium]